MARQGIFTGFTPNDGLGDSLATGATKVNLNFQELYGLLGDGNVLDPNVGSGGTWSKGNGELGIYTSKYVGINTLTPRTHLQVEGNVYISGVATGRFVGDGSGLTGITAVGSGVVIKDNGTLIGVAQTINFGDYIAVGTVFGGNVTINGVGTAAYASVAGVATYAILAGVASLSNYTPLAGLATYTPIAGVATFATVAGFVTYAQGAGVATAAGNAFYASLAGVATYATIAGISTNSGYATTAGIATVARNLTGSPSIVIDNIYSLAGIVTIPGQGSKVRFDFDSTGDLPSATSWRGMFAFANNTKSAYVSMGTTDGGYNGWRRILAEDLHGNYATPGILTATRFFGDGSGLVNLPGTDSYWNQSSVGLTTLANVGLGTTNPTSKLTVNGSVLVSGVSTFAGITTVTGDTLFAKQVNATGVITASKFETTFTGSASTISSPSTLNINAPTVVVSGITTIRNGGMRVAGVVTATSFVGDGSGLTGITAAGSGVALYDDNVLIGTASSINFGTNISVSSVVSGIATVSGASSVSNATTAYGLAGNPALNVSSVVAGSLSAGTGPITGGSISGTTINANSLVSPNINASGISTIATLRVGSAVTIASYGIEATAGVITALAYVGDGSGLTNLNATRLTSGTVSNSRLPANITVAGIISALSFVGDGAGITGVIASGTGIIIRDDGILVGTAGSIDFGSGLSVSTVSAGVVTVTSSGGATQFVTTAAGIHTLSNVGIGTTNPTSKLSVTGDARISGVITASSFQSSNLGSPEITSTSLLTINAPRVAISTTLTTGGNVGLGTTNPGIRLHVVGNSLITGITSVKQLSDYKALVGAASSTTETFVVTVAAKSSNHRYFGTGSNSGYYIDGRESPFITLLPGKRYRFDQSDASNNTHQLRFYLEADRTTEYQATVTLNGTAGSAGAYTEINIVDTTPTVLHYQCVNHGYMGNSVQTNSNVSSSGGSSGSSVIVKDEGTTIGTAGILDFVGSGVTATFSGSTATISITASSGGGGSIAGINTSGTSTFTHINATGIITSTSFRTNTTLGNGSDVGFAIKYYITSNGASSYSFAGPGVVNSTANPTLYLHRGFTYIFENSTGSSHPFAIRTSSGGSAYTSSFLSGSQSGTQIFTVPFDAPNTLVYQCTIHAAMVGTLNIVT